MQLPGESARSSASGRFPERMAAVIEHPGVDIQVRLTLVPVLLPIQVSGRQTNHEASALGVAFIQAQASAVGFHHQLGQIQTQAGATGGART